MITFTGPNTSHTFTFIDEDGAVSSGFYILMDGTYDDVDEDGKTDVCQDVVFKVTDSQGVDVTEDASQLTCLASDVNSEFSDEMRDELPDDGRVIFGYVCATIDSEVEYKCNIGENYTISSEVSIYVFNADEYDLAFLGGFEQLFGSGLFAIAGSCCCGLGGILLLVGLLTGGKPSSNDWPYASTRYGLGNADANSNPCATNRGNAATTAVRSWN